MLTFYNEIDRYCCDWLQNLMDAGLISPGKIDDRSIEDIAPDDLKGYEKCHFFAGIGGWELALQMSGYDGPVWTGSCPCQPFSSAGKQKGQADKRHLWPVWYELIRVCKPPRVFGEQVAAAIKHGWIDLVQSDLEGEGYALRFAVLPACGVGAPHIRQRLWFVGDADGELADAKGKQMGVSRQSWALGNADSIGREGQDILRQRGSSSWWSGAEYLPCTDGKQRPTKPGIFPLAHGVSARVGKLRAIGNAIVPQVAAAFIEATT